MENLNEEKMITLTNKRGETREISIKQFEAILDSRTAIEGPCKVHTVVTGVSFWNPQEQDPNDERPARHIINFKLMSTHNDAEANRLISEGEFQKALNENMTMSRFVNDDGQPSGFLPVAGEPVVAYVGWIYSENLKQDILVVTAITEIPLIQPKKIKGRFSKAINGENSQDSEFKNIEVQAKKTDITVE